jgi:membrane protein implicated in regulation of membrane protease activity
MGVLLAPSTGVPPWLDIILMLLLTIVMWVALRPFRRLTQMVSSQHNHFAGASGGVSTVTRSAARTSGRILTTALGTFLGVSAAARGGANQQVEAQAAEGGTVQRSEANTSYQPLVTAPAEGVPANLPPAETGAGVPGGPPTAPAYASGGAAKQPAALSGSMQINAGAVTVVGPVSGGAGGAERPGEIYAPAGRAGGSRAESGTAAHRAADGADGAGPDHTAGPAGGGRFESGGAGSGAPGNRGLVSTGPASSYYGTAMDGLPDGRPTDRGFQRPEGAPADDFDLDELNEVFRPDTVRQQ